MRLAIVAGEASGDLHAAHVVRELKKLEPDLTTFGIGGDLLAKQKMELIHHASELGMVGFFNVIRHLPMFIRIKRDLMERIGRERPDAVLLVDYPGFNMRVARDCKKLGIRVVYYISPQIWAWRRGRVRQIAETVDHMIVLFPFEEQFYRDHGVPVSYVGHPIIEQVAGVRRVQRREKLRVALLPGSRKQEVDTLLPPMLDAVAELRKDTNIDAYIIQAPTIEHDKLEQIVQRKNANVPILPHDRGEAIAAADVALSSSGTATLECAVLGTPAIVMYRLSRMTYVLAQRLVKVPHFSLVNIVAEKEVVPELIQDDVNGVRIAAEVRRMVEPSNYERITRELAEVRARLGEEGASRRAAEAIVNVVRT
ncbi:MAG TPA: lipid-A-disaccharide synthase [Thermoanaerobaculia bacterium]|nr:lipid-A-disaccharide synthase [Thermoanaerobaculia bacterium]